MKLVIDTNRIIAALLRNSTTRFLLLHPSLVFVAPLSSRAEIEKHREFLQVKTHLHVDDFEDVLATLFSRIHIEERAAYEQHIVRAQKLLVDKDDVPFLALALSQGIPIWSDDKHFQAQRLVKTYTTAELLQTIKKR